MKVFWLLLLVSSVLPAVTVDRIAIVVNQRIVTEMQLDEELRVTALLNHEPVKRDGQTRRAAADRLVEQELVRHEMELSEFPFPTEEQVNTAFEGIAKQFGGVDQFRKEVQPYELNEAIVKQHIGFQLMLLKFVDSRFRPDVEVSENDIRERYNREAEKWRAAHGPAPPPTLAQSRDSLEKAISDERADYALNSWLAETRKEVNIVYLDKDLA
jgi:hypothetical protein